tara:strand:+ start:853 stop:1242 length:390 start_codon:yes stop_codon:yes gene_type:complete
MTQVTQMMIGIDGPQSQQQKQGPQQTQGPQRQRRQQQMQRPQQTHRQQQTQKQRQTQRQRRMQRQQGHRLLEIVRAGDPAFMVNRNGLIQMLPPQPKEILVDLIHTNSREPLMTLLRRVTRVARAYWKA